jgi:hypothetical protein
MGRYTYLHDPHYRSAGVNDQGQFRRVRIQVQTDDPNLNESDVQVDSGYYRDQVDPLDSAKFLRSIEVSRDAQNPYYWQMILEYRADILAGQDPEKSQISPLQRPPEYDWSWEESPEPIEVDINGKKICSTAGEMFDPPPTKPFVDLVASVTFYRDSWNAAAMQDLVNTVNSDVWYGWPAGTVRFFSPRCRSVVESPWPVCFQITYTFKCRPDGWKLKIFNQGTYEWDGTIDNSGNRNYRRIKDANDRDDDRLRAIDDEGRAIPLGQFGQPLETIPKLEFDLFPAIPFAQFGV